MKLSIITINRNNAEGLQRTLESVAAQTCRDFEHIIIDGASTDGSVDAIKEYAKTSKNIHWVSEPDNGIYQAMNKGIQKAMGEYLLFLNSGDFLVEHDVIERVIKQCNGADIVSGRCNVSDKGEVVWTSPYLPQITLYTLYSVGLPHQSTCIRKVLFEQLGYYREDFRYNSDIEFWYRAIIFNNCTAKGIDIIVADYNLGGISSKEVKSKAYQKEMQEILSMGFLPKVLPDYDQWKNERAILNQYAWIESHPIIKKSLSYLRKLFKRI